MPADVTIPLLSRRRERLRWLGQTYQRLQHVLPCGILLTDGYQAMAAGATGMRFALACGELAFSALLIVFIARALFTRASNEAHHPEAINWADLLAAVVVALETYVHWRDTGHVTRPNIIMVMMLTALGVFHGRLMAWSRGRRSLVISDGGLRIGGATPIHPGFAARWPDIARIDITDEDVHVVTRSGRQRRIGLADLRNGAEVADALYMVQQRLKG